MTNIPYSSEGGKDDPFDALMRLGVSKYGDHEELVSKADTRPQMEGSEYFAYEDVKPGMLYAHALESVREFGFLWSGNTRHYDVIRDVTISENWFWSPLGILAVVRGTKEQAFVNMCLFFNIIPSVPAVFDELGISGHYEKPLGNDGDSDVFVGDLMLVNNMRGAIKSLQDNGTFLTKNWQSLPLPLRYSLGHDFLSDEELEIFGHERDPEMPRAVKYINRKILEAIGVDYERHRWV